MLLLDAAGRKNPCCTGLSQDQEGRQRLWRRSAVNPRVGGLRPGSRPGSSLPHCAALGQSLNLSVFPLLTHMAGAVELLALTEHIVGAG